MRVAMYYNNRDVRLEEMAVPKIAPGELLVRIRASGICGSDLMEWYRIKKAPLVLGNEIAGEVVEVGEGVKDFQPGDRVFASHHVPCGKCRYCLAGHQSVCDMLRTTHFDPGGFAELIRVPKINVELGTFLLPDEVTFDEGSFIEPLACVVRAQRFARLTAGQTVLVIGGGISGLLHIQLARARGAGRIIATGSCITEVADFGGIRYSVCTASKGGIVMMLRPMAAEMARHGITVNAVSPGYIATEMLEEIDPAGLESALRLVPMRPTLELPSVPKSEGKEA